MLGLTGNLPAADSRGPADTKILSFTHRGLGALRVSQIKKPRSSTLLSHLILSQILLLALVRMRYLSPPSSSPCVSA